MNKTVPSESNFNLWLLIGQVSHSIILVRQRELSQYRIPVRQYQVLCTIQDLGSDATLSELSKQLEREVHVISRQAVRMENDGLIKRIKSNPKSNLLRLELTEKGLDMIKMGKQSKSIDTIFSSLTGEERRQMESTLNKMLNKVKECYPA